jgi:hypothetical protein
MQIAGHKNVGSIGGSQSPPRIGGFTGLQKQHEKYRNFYLDSGIK